MPEPLHVLVIPSWYPQSEQDVDGIFFKIRHWHCRGKASKPPCLHRCSATCGKKQQAS
ncbi:hypothetical protein NMB0847 [Neisseria meningitidis MC58]|uniref:Uncharacterized protein n=1 Tax=Neisseria meningitidis serogroup B (strain ATCC BAA-335 / MC58) TaxID=122586 RepID=Q9JZY5_NEIMB|nr:hypothetical protein NMB0847 [Neisseria meningitidis MC58]